MSTPPTSQASYRICRQVAQIHPCGQAPELFYLQRPDPEASPCIGFGHSVCWVRHARNSACSYVLGQFLVSELPPAPEAGIHTSVRLTCRELAQAWQRRMLKGEPLARNHSILDKEAINWLRCTRWERLIDTDKNLGTALVESQWIELWLSKMTRHISRTQTLGIITERAIGSSVIEEKQGIFSVNSSSTFAPSFGILAKIHKQPFSGRPFGDNRNFCLGSACAFLSSYLQPVVKSYRHAIGPHAPIIGWAETAQLEEHDIMFTSDREALYPSIHVWPGVGGLCLFLTLSSEPSDVSTPSTRPGRVYCEVAAPCPVHTAHAVRRCLFLEVTWSLSTGLQSASEVANLYLDVLDLPRVAEFWCSQVSLPRHGQRFWGP